MSIIYFDICSIPLFLIILAVCFIRRMTKGVANRLFILVVLLSLFSAVTDLGMEIANNATPLSEAGRLFCSVCTYIYLILRNATNVVLLLFLLALTRTSFLIGKRWAKVAYFLPYGLILLMLVLNPFTQVAFTVTAETGYARGPLMYAFYGIALLYGLVGLAYCIYCRRYLPLNKWGSLLAIYVLCHIAVAIQFFRPELLLEMFCTGVGEMLIMFSIMRPEERMDSEVSMLSWASYQADLKNILLSGERVQIAVIRMPNSRELRSYLGDQEFNRYITQIGSGLRSLRWTRPSRIELYYERPGTVYLIADGDETGVEGVAQRLSAEDGGQLRRYEERGVRFEPRVCLIRCPEDLQKAEDIINLGHIFQKYDGLRQTAFHAAEIVRSESFAVEVRIREILERAVREDGVEMYFQPIYNAAQDRFTSAEALARINDPEFGIISPSVFIPAAEELGYIIPIGDAVLDQTFRFVSEEDLQALGISYIEVNLSVAQCMESSLPDKIRALQQKYGVDPAQINLEITETTFDSISEIMLENVQELIRMGYSFALDDYGTGYSNIQRVNHIPLRLIKIDKSMLDEISSENGRKILIHTVQMMQSIGKQLVTEGAETAEVVESLREMGCDYIQGFYFSRPLPREEFVHFIKEHNFRMEETK